MNLFYRETGTGPSVVILHGLFGSSDNWQTFARELAASGFRVLTVDLRNHGQSPHSPVFDFSSMAADVASCIQTTCKEPVYLIGHSLGGKVTMQLALTQPGLLRGITVIDIAPRYYTPHHQKIIAGLKAINLSTLQSRKEAEELLMSHIPEPGVRQFLLKNLYRKEKDQFEWRFDLNSISASIENVGAVIHSAHPCLLPALFIRGQKSDYIGDNDKKEIELLFPTSKILTAPGAGHWVHADNPEWLLQTLLPEIRKCTS
ncbi:MAG TPA: alpha/beta fold hydrolase [Bacteroidia bacterium]|nr:alpha/beta fold hydrolase [Bacteroidia bacterium]